MFAIRIGGTNDFVSKINPDDARRYPPGSVNTVSGWGHAHTLVFDTREAAEEASQIVFEIEGFHTMVEQFQSDL